MDLGGHPTATTAVPTSPFKTILNFRDIGQTINALDASLLLRRGLVYRGARPDEATLEDQRSLISNYRIKTIIDLRSKTEHVQQGRKHDARLRDTTTLLPSESAIAPLKIPNVCYHDISLNGSSYEILLLKRLRYASLAKLITLMLLGRRTEAIAILGKEVIQPRGLVGQATDVIDSSATELKQIFQVLADAQYPIFIHCTSGKDRTGLVAFILLMILDVPLHVVSVDYTASQGELVSERLLRTEELRAMGLSDDFADCPPNWANDVHRHIIKTYGSCQAYLDRTGIGEALRHRIRSNLLQE
ncbi:MAG: hypothetical protein L6R36_005118 [Xanthoria steineri]|nr:MAG: hypothetical protein L6R36_005118 [Xanthoria steineri]